VDFLHLKVFSLRFDSKFNNGFTWPFFLSISKNILAENQLSGLEKLKIIKLNHLLRNYIIVKVKLKTISIKSSTYNLFELKNDVSSFLRYKRLNCLSQKSNLSSRLKYVYFCYQLKRETML
jgi:hypothetical protein